MIHNQTATDRVLKARKLLILDAPWYGMLSMRLTVQEVADARRCPTMQTDGTKLEFNPAFVQTLSDAQLKGLWAHEVSHCALGHPWRVGTRDLDLANQAADYVVNGLLRKDRFELPESALFDPRFENGMGFEQAYAILWREKQQEMQKPQPQQDDQQNDSEQEKDEHGDDSDGDTSDQNEEENGDGDPGTSGEDEEDEQDSGAGDGDSEADSDQDSDSASGGSDEGAGDSEDGESQDGQGHPGAERPGSFIPAQEPQDTPENEPKPMNAIDWQIAAEEASRVAHRAGNMPGDVKRAIEAGRQETTDWREILQRFVERTIASDYSMTKPNRRFVGQGLYVPGIVKENTPRLAVAIDTSGSITPRVLNLAGTHLTSILHELRPEAIDTYYIDTRVHQFQSFSPDDPEVKLDPNGGGGGTLFQPLFDYIETHLDEREYPAAMIYFTDLENCDGQLIEPPYPVLWVTTEASNLEGQFGETIRISEYE